MPDIRVRKLAKTIVRHSIDVKPKDKVLVLADHVAEDMTQAVITEIYMAGGIPFSLLRSEGIERAIIEKADPDALEFWGKTDADYIKQMDGYVEIKAAQNYAEFATLSYWQRNLYLKHYRKQINMARGKTKWVCLICPNDGLAQLAGMGTDMFKDYFFKITNIDYDKLGRATEPIAKRMREVDKVRIVTKDTDLRLSLKGFTAIVANGLHNLPDGEIASTPVRDSVNGVITFNIPSLRHGFLYQNIRLTFKNGQVVEASANDTDRFLYEISIDPNARYIGEFSLGTNPFIRRHINNTIFDEKMCGSLHMALGCCYNFPGRDNGNYSAIHWDLVQSHLPEYGGGEVWFDGELIRKDGVYLPDDLCCLNPDVYGEY